MYVRLVTFLAGAATLAGLGLGRVDAAVGLDGLLADRLSPAPSQLLAAGQPVSMPGAVARFYDTRAFRPAWVRHQRVSTQATELLAYLDDAGRHGLDPADYHAPALDEILGRLLAAPQHSWDPGLAVAAELLLTDGFLSLGADLLRGRIAPEHLDTHASAPSLPPAELAQRLHRGLITAGPQATLEGLLPAHPGYQALRDALVRYRRVASAGGWARLTEGPALAVGDQGSRVATLRARLAATGDWQGRSDDPPAFDETLASAVLAFQRRHGLAADGVVGPRTRATLNVPAQARVQQLIANLERWRWLPRHLGDRYVLVNIAGFELRAVDHGRDALSMRVIVGRPYRRTPVFSGELTHMVLNPPWFVPPTIYREDILPKLREDVDYLERHNMMIYRRGGDGLEPLPPSSVDWGAVKDGPPSYVLRQAPGPTNPLGQIKFMFPNPYDVYLHDTPDQDLFDNERRSLSSGCIRVEDPWGLGGFLMNGDSAWDAARLAAAADKRQPQRVGLPNPVPVHLVYWTAWAQAHGEVHFRPDIYNRDRAVLAALRGSAQKADSAKGPRGPAGPRAGGAPDATARRTATTSESAAQP